MLPSYCHWDYEYSQLVQDLYTDEQAQEVAKLSRYCGQAVEMGYSPEGSGAYTSDQLAAMKQFGYSSNAQYVTKSGWWSSNYTTSEWEAMMKAELNAGRPILYAANDVKWLKQIMDAQRKVLDERVNAINGAKLECDFIPALAYLEWCGIKLDIAKWRVKMKFDEDKLKECKSSLDNLFIKRAESHPAFKKFITINTQGDLFEGFDLTPKVNANWDSSQQVTQIMKELGFNTTVQDKETGEDKDSVLEKQLKGQKGIDDEFLDRYLEYKEFSKVCSTYGQSYIDAINPRTGRIHTVFRAMGASSGRMSCGSNQNNNDLAKEKKIRFAGYPQLQNLPANEATRSSFVAEKGNLFCSCDYSA
jgi:DNA polymerase I-like protein with 3'-5' exonuclease and polymerase domains